MEGKKIYVLVKNLSGVNDDVELFNTDKAAKRAFKRYTGFAYNDDYQFSDNERFSEKFSETKLFEMELPCFLTFRK